MAGHHAPWSVAPGRFMAQHCATVFKKILKYLMSRKYSRLQKFVETGRSVHKLQNKFCVNPLEQHYTVGLTHLTFVQYFIIQNSKISDTKVIVYKYLGVQIF
jgi:hypothetical protein